MSAMGSTAVDLLREWIGRQVPEQPAAWLDQQLEKLGAAESDRDLHIGLGMCPRRLGKDDLSLDAGDLESADRARPGWDPRGWSVDEAARILMLLTGGGGQAFADRFTGLCRSAEVGEAIAFYRGLPLYPDPELLEDQAAEGIRSNMRAVFEAVAHRNPFPRERFDRNRWNQMVLKALFVDSTLYPMQGLDDRANPELAHVLCDTAHERWAAGRAVSPELWRCVGPYAVGRMLDDLRKVLSDGNETERKAAALALSASPSAKAREILAGAADLAQLIESGDLFWDGLVNE
jgi:hypothetical protein